MVKATRESLIKLTVKEITDHGYQNITLRGLAAEINATTGVVYSHFKSKNELFSAVTLSLSNDLASRDVYNDFSDSKATLIKILDDVIKWYETKPNLVHFFLANPSLDHVFDDNKLELPFFDLIYKHIENIHEQVGHDFNEREMYIRLWSFIYGYIMLLEQKMATTNPEFVTKTVELLINE